MAERKRLECRNHGNCLWILEYMTSCDGHLPEWDGDRHDCAEYEPMPDVKELAKLADEIDSMERVVFHNEVRVSDDVLASVTRRIREALGVVE